MTPSHPRPKGSRLGFFCGWKIFIGWDGIDRLKQNFDNVMKLLDQASTIE
jgi:hypothetical protein